MREDISPGTDLDVVRRYKPLRGGDVEPRVGEEPLALCPEDLLDRRRLAVHRIVGANVPTTGP